MQISISNGLCADRESKVQCLQSISNVQWHCKNKSNQGNIARNFFVSFALLLLRMQEYKFHNGTIWFVRFSMDPRSRILACGSQTGIIYIWDLEDDGKKNAEPMFAVQSLGKAAEFPKTTVSFPS